MRSLLFVGGNAAVVAALYFSVAKPAADMLEEQRDSIQRQAQLLGRYRNIGDQADRVEALGKQMNDGSRPDDFLAGASDGAVSAKLQARLKAATEAAGASLRSVRALPARQSDGMGYAGARVEISGTNRAVQATLYQVEFSQPHLTITACIIRAALQRTGDGEPLLDAQFDAFGPVRARPPGE